MQDIHVEDPERDQRSINASLRERVANLEDRVARLELALPDKRDTANPMANSIAETPEWMR